MHEQSLMEHLIHNIEEIAKENNGARVTRVEVRLGALSHISPEHFHQHFQEASKGSMAEGAQLDLIMDEDTNADHAQDVILETVGVEEA